jgi:hypothetical protein
LFIWTGGHISLRVVNVTWVDFDSLAFILHFLNQFRIASRSVCSLYMLLHNLLNVLVQIAYKMGLQKKIQDFLVVLKCGLIFDETWGSDY